MAIDSDREPRRLLWPSVLTALSLFVLLGLGTWQLERKAWKEDLIAKIRVRSLAEPMVLDAATMLVKSGEEIEYTRVRARGRPSVGKALFYFANEAEGPGYHVYVPFQTPGGELLLVNRGFIGQPQREAFVAAARSAAQQGAVSDIEIVGLLRYPGRKGLFAPENDVQRNLWFWRDHAGMAKAVGANGNSTVLPYFLEEAAPPAAQNAEARRPAVSRPVVGGSPPVLLRPGVTRIELPNRHLEYALTWYGLAVALIVVYLIYVAKAQRSSRDRRLLGAMRRRSWGNP